MHVCLLKPDTALLGRCVWVRKAHKLGNLVIADAFDRHLIVNRRFILRLFKICQFCSQYIVLDARSFKTHISIATCLYHLLVYTGTIRQFPFEKLIIVSEFKKLERINLLRYKS